MTAAHHPRLRPQPRAVLAGVALLFVAACQTAEDAPPMPEGSVGSALFEAHCLACHGRFGRGDGRAAIALTARPRDFRNEPFFYVSVTEGGPTDDDLLRTIRDGRPGGEMPAHPWLTPEETRILADYVRDLNRLGWMERLRTEFEGEDFEPGELEEIAAERAAAGEPVEVSPRSTDYRFDPDRGYELYMASCASCHGPSGRGDGLDMPLDEQGRPIPVRDLTRGRFRGGSSGEAIYRRILCGIPGTPMPAAEDTSSDDVWQLVDYVRYLAGLRR